MISSKFGSRMFHRPFLVRTIRFVTSGVMTEENTRILRKCLLTRNAQTLQAELLNILDLTGADSGKSNRNGSNGERSSRTGSSGNVNNIKGPTSCRTASASSSSSSSRSTNNSCSGSSQNSRSSSVIRSSMRSSSTSQRAAGGMAVSFPALAARVCIAPKLADLDLVFEILECLDEAKPNSMLLGIYEVIDRCLAFNHVDAATKAYHRLNSMGLKMDMSGLGRLVDAMVYTCRLDDLAVVMSNHSLSEALLVRVVQPLVFSGDFDMFTKNFCRFLDQRKSREVLFQCPDEVARVLQSLTLAWLRRFSPRHDVCTHIRLREAAGLKELYATMEVYHMRLSTSHDNYTDYRGSPSFIALCQFYNAVALTAPQGVYLVDPALSEVAVTNMWTQLLPGHAGGNHVFPYLPEGDGMQHMEVIHQLKLNDLTQEIRRQRRPRLLLYHSALFPHAVEVDAKLRQVPVINEYVLRKNIADVSDNVESTGLVGQGATFDDEDEDFDDDDDDEEDEEDDDDDMDSLTTQHDDGDDDGDDGIVRGGGDKSFHAMTVAHFFHGLEDLSETDPEKHQFMQHMRRSGRSGEYLTLSGEYIPPDLSSHLVGETSPPLVFAEEFFDFGLPDEDLSHQGSGSGHQGASSSSSSSSSGLGASIVGMDPMDLELDLGPSDDPDGIGGVGMGSRHVFPQEDRHEDDRTK